MRGRVAQYPRPRWLIIGWPLTESGASPCRIKNLADKCHRIGNTDTCHVIVNTPSRSPVRKPRVLLPQSEGAGTASYGSSGATCGWTSSENGSALPLEAEYEHPAAAIDMGRLCLRVRLRGDLVAEFPCALR